jgi:hypothetical protein
MIFAILAILVVGPFRPDPALTPGVLALGPDGKPLSVAVLCTTIWHRDARHVSEGMKIEVARRYHVYWPPLRKGHRFTRAERAARAKWEIDHFWSRSEGGADDVDNLWMQPIEDARRKDVLEARLHREMCATWRAGGNADAMLQDARRQLAAWGRER